MWAGSPAAGTGGPKPCSTELFPVPLQGAGPGLTGRNHVTAVTWGPDPTPHDLQRPSRVLFTNGISEIVKSGLTGLTNGLNISFYWANSHYEAPHFPVLSAQDIKLIRRTSEESHQPG